jgi:Na+-translocating ferredoxin:NAD+ oxidoreductase subunit D
MVNATFINKAPFIRQKSTVNIVMMDVVIALLPLVFFAWLAHGLWAITVILLCVVSSLLTDLIFSALLLKKTNTIFDGTSIITGLLLSFTLSPFTNWGVVIFGGFSAILFGKILWGGLGKNLINPALLGREFMTAFFPDEMNSSSLWSGKNYINIDSEHFFNNIPIGKTVQTYIYRPYGAVGEYSILFLILGGLYLLIRKRISWHIPVGLTLVFTILNLISPISENIAYGGLLLGAIYMATDMPSSPVTHMGKTYYGVMIGVVAFILLKDKISHEYMSFSIILLNVFSQKINNVFEPRAWAKKLDYRKRLNQISSLTIQILITTLAVMSLFYFKLTQWAVYIFIVYIILQFTNKSQREIDQSI